MTLQEEIDRMLENNTQKVSTQKYISFAKSMLNSGMSIGKAVEIQANSGSSPDEIAVALQAAGVQKDAVASALREAGKISQRNEA